MKNLIFIIILLFALSGSSQTYTANSVNGAAADNTGNVPAVSMGMPYWVKITKAYTDFDTSELTNDISIYTLPINGYIHDIKIIPTTAFSGGTIDTYTISVGIVGALAKYAVATDVFTGNATLTTVHTPLIGMESTSGTTDIRAQATSTVGNLDAATAGSVTFLILVSVVP